MLCLLVVVSLVFVVINMTTATTAPEGPAMTEPATRTVSTPMTTQGPATQPSRGPAPVTGPVEQPRSFTPDQIMLRDPVPLPAN